jgi:flagellar hook assembly protein FlgD
MDAPARVRLSVYDVRGRLVNVLVDGRRDVGHHAVAWDGRTASGRQARAGAHFYRLEVTGASSTSALQTKKLAITK